MNALIQCLFALSHFCTTFRLPVAGSLQESLEVFLKPTSSDNFCHFCGEIMSVCVVREFLDCGSYHIIQLQRFCKFRGAFTKSADIAISLPTSQLESENKQIFHKFSLKGVINHLGTLNNGHYSAIVKDISSSVWYHCVNATVFPCRRESVNSSSSYVYFFQISHLSYRVVSFFCL